METTHSQDHKLFFDVRDYECDMQGIVNNAVYQNYLEHARHQFIKSRGLDFAEITAQGIHLVLIKAETHYKRPLKSGDHFYVTTKTERLSRFKILFRQNIYRKDDTFMLEAQMTTASITPEGRPVVFTDLDKLL